MRWLTLMPLLVSLGCSLFSGGVTGAWSSSNGLEVEIQQDRSWKGTYPTGIGKVELTGQWNMEDKTLSLIPSSWKVRTDFPGMKVSGRDKEQLNRDARFVVEMVREKKFVLTKDGNYDTLKDLSPAGDQSMYRVE